jgi:hypothetical protein
MCITDLITQPWFLSLSDVEKLKILQLDVGSSLVHTLAGLDQIQCKKEGYRMPSDQEWLLLSESVKAHDQQINTLLGVLTGPNGNGGLSSDIKDIKVMLSNIEHRFHELDKSQDLLRADNKSEHDRIKSDVDGIGRKATRACEKADKVEADFEKYRKDQINSEEQKITKTHDRKFEWYHAVVVGVLLLIGDAILRYYVR